MGNDLLRGHLDRLLLAVLDGQSGHGYALCQRIEERSGGEIEVPEGSLYPALKRLERQGLVASRWENVDGRWRRTYCLVESGRRRAARDRQEWRTFSVAVDRVLGGAS
jgi:PadR family transcriptional regulator PadR